MVADAATVFDAEIAETMMKDLRAAYDSGVTKSYDWRVSQLSQLLKLVEYHQDDITSALQSDLAKPETECYVYEIEALKNSIKLALKELRKWMSPEKVKTALVALPSSARIVPEPLGIVLIISAWNYPFGNGVVGRIVMAAAAKHLTPVLLELGGKCPVVVDGNINLQVACRRIIMGKWGSNSGQTCVSPDYIITTKANAPKLIDALKTELEKFYGKNMLKSNDLSRIVNSKHFARLTKLLDEDKVSGKVVYGGKRDESILKIMPTILLDVPRDSLMMKEEIFGPLLPILTVDRLEDSFNIINSGTKPLAAYLFTNDIRFRERFAVEVSSGALVVNDTTIHLGVPTLPFGGVGESGMGSYHGKFSFEAFSHKKAVLYRGFVADADARYPPYTRKKLRLLQALLGGSFLTIILALFGRA